MSWKPAAEGIKCAECNFIIKSSLGFPAHLRAKHNLIIKDYYIKYFKDKSEGLCKYCSKDTKFIGMNQGFRKFCSQKCAMKYRILNQKTAYINPFSTQAVKEKIRKTMLKKYGVNHPMKSPEILEKIKKTNKEKYGVEWQISSGSTCEKSALTNESRYGSRNVFGSKEVMNTIRAVNREKFGTDFPLQAEVNKLKAQETMLLRYGARHPSQVPSIRRKQCLAAKSINAVEINGVLLEFQGTYEKRFLENHLKQFNIEVSDLTQDISIPYIDPSGKNRVYIPDFVNSKTKTVIEIKSLWTFDNNGVRSDFRDMNLAKVNGAELAGYNLLYVMMNRDGIIWTANSSQQVAIMTGKKS